MMTLPPTLRQHREACPRDDSQIFKVPLVLFVGKYLFYRKFHARGRNGQRHIPLVLLRASCPLCNFSPKQLTFVNAIYFITNPPFCQANRFGISDIFRFFLRRSIRCGDSGKFSPPVFAAGRQKSGGSLLEIPAADNYFTFFRALFWERVPVFPPPFPRFAPLPSAGLRFWAATDPPCCTSLRGAAGSSKVRSENPP